MLLAGVVLFLRLAWLQVVEAGALRRKAAGQYRARVVLHPYRGIIYDRGGRPMTENLGDWVALGISPNQVGDPARLARDLARVTGRPSAKFL
jgi:cell division protein FtsI/penicillin-binding protein 2